MDWFQVPVESTLTETMSYSENKRDPAWEGARGLRYANVAQKNTTGTVTIEVFCFVYRIL